MPQKLPPTPHVCNKALHWPARISPSIPDQTQYFRHANMDIFKISMFAVRFSQDHSMKGWSQILALFMGHLPHGRFVFAPPGGFTKANTGKNGPFHFGIGKIAAAESGAGKVGII